jgi:hypothetical protein
VWDFQPTKHFVDHIGQKVSICCFGHQATFMFNIFIECMIGLDIKISGECTVGIELHGAVGIVSSDLVTQLLNRFWQLVFTEPLKQC